MARSHLGNRTDGNQKELVKYFRAWGCSVLIISDLPSCCDIIIAKHGRTIAVEIKDGSKPKSARKLTEGERLFEENWSGAWRLVESTKDADAIIAELNNPAAIPLR